MEVVNAPTADGFLHPLFTRGANDARNSALLVSTSLVIHNRSKMNAAKGCGLLCKKERPIVGPSQCKLILIQAKTELRFHFRRSFHPPEKKSIRPASRTHVILQSLIRVHEVPQ